VTRANPALLVVDEIGFQPVNRSVL